MDDPGAAPFRSESLQYLAVLIAEPRWSGKAVPAPLSAFERPEVARRLAGPESWIHELLAETARVFEGSAEYALAERGWHLAAARAPNSTVKARYRMQATAAAARK